MPYVNVQITQGATKQQKAQIIKDITQSLVNVLGKKTRTYSYCDSRNS